MYADEAGAIYVSAFFSPLYTAAAKGSYCSWTVKNLDEALVFLDNFKGDQHTT